MMASKGHFLTQMPQPMHSSSEIQAILLLGLASTQSFPILTTGQNFLHSCRHFFGLHLRRKGREQHGSPRAGQRGSGMAHAPPVATRCKQKEASQRLHTRLARAGPRQP